jgi:assimilatory nitrate reductase catalytic subunit
VRVTTIVRSGEVFIPFHWDERCANRLTDDDFDPISREPNYKQCAVRVEACAT